MFNRASFLSLLWLLAPLFACLPGFSQAPGDYRTITASPLVWNDASKWEVYDGMGWVAAATPPDQSAGKISILHQTWVYQNTTADEIEILSGGHLITYDTLFLNDGAGIDLRQTEGSLTHYAAILGNGGSPSVSIESGATCNWRSGILGAEVTLTVQTGATLILGVSGSNPLNAGTVINYGTMNWADYSIGIPFGWTLSGTLHNYATFNITSNNFGGYIYLHDQKLTNHSGGVINLDLQDAFSLSTVYMSNSFATDGFFQNNGTVNVNKGRLTLFQDALHTGTFNVSNLSLLDFWIAEHQFSGTVVFAGAGEVRKYGNWTLLGSLTLPCRFLYWGNDLKSSGGNYTLTLTHPADTLQGCNIFDNASLRVAPTGGLLIRTAASREIHGTIHNEGVIDWVDGMLFCYSAPFGSILNEGTFNAYGTGSAGTLSMVSLFFDNKIGGSFNKYGLDVMEITDYFSAVTFISKGNFNVIEGNLNLNVPLGADHDGLLDIAAGATLHLGFAFFASPFNSVATNLIVNGAISGQKLQLSNPTSKVEINGTGSIQRLGINTPQHTQFNANFLITTRLEFVTGRILLNGNMVLNFEGAEIVNYGTNNYIDVGASGRIKRSVVNGSTVFFPIGLANGYSPAEIALAPAAATDNFLLSCRDSLYLNYDLSGNPIGYGLTDANVARTWYVEEEVPGGSDVSLALYWLPAMEVPSFDGSSNVQLIHYSGGSWLTGPLGSAAQAGSLYYYTRAGITSFSPFGVSNVNPFPAELHAFEAFATPKSTVLLKWASATEINVMAYVLEKADEAGNFGLLREVAAKGNSDQLTPYAFTDDQPHAGINVYRLSSVDFDGKSQDWGIRKVLIAAADEPLLYPNPTTDFIYLDLSRSASSAGYFAYKIVGASGELVREGQGIAQTKLQAISVRELTAGTYILWAKNGSEEWHFEFIKR